MKITTNLNEKQECLDVCWAIEVQLENGQKFALRDYEGTLVIAVDGELVVCPRAANLIRLTIKE